MTDYLEYPNVLQEVRGAMHPGRLKLQGTNLVFKNIKTGKVDHFEGTEVDKVNWLIRARGFCLKVMLKNGTVHRFDGFKEDDFDKLSQFVKRHYSTDLEKQDLSTKGWNWGTANFIGNSLTFEVGNKLAFEVPLNNVSASTTNKSEVTLEFHQNDDAAVSLTEMRFHIPIDANNVENDPVLDFHQNVMAKADIIQAVGESIALFPEAQCLTPRGRYDLKIYPTFLQLHGKTFDYKIPYTTVLRLFLLPHKDNRQMFFVISLDPPIKQGQTRYHFVILLYNKEDETTVELTLSDEDIQEKFEGKLAKEMSGPEYEIISRIMKAFVNRKITVPGSFKSFSSGSCISCSYKASNGFLYPLERGFLYVHKPPVHIRFDECSCVNFARSAATTRSFDFEVETKSGNTYTFSSIEKDEYGKLYDFVKNKHLRVKNIGGKLDQPQYDDMMDSDTEDNHDAYLERMKREGQERDDDDDDDEDESEDEDFKPPESGSDVAEEFDSDATSSENEGSDAGGGDENKEKKKKKKEHKAKTVREGPKRKRKTKKDPNAPKRPQSSYFLWLNDNRERIKKENPGIAITEVSKIAGEQWKTAEKTKYEALAVKAKESYAVAMKEYLANKKDESEDENEDKSSKSPKKAKKAKKTKTPSKTDSPAKSKASGSGTDFKSKEFISSSDSSGDESKSSKKKPAKKKAKKESDVEMPSEDEKKPVKKDKKKKKKEESEEEEVQPPTSEEESAGSEDDKPLKKADKGKKKKKADSEVDELPSDEEILSSPEHSSANESNSGSGGSESGSGSGADEDDD